MRMTTLTTVARQELLISLRSRWILVFSVVFGALSLGISYFGMVTSGAAGVQGFERTTASLLNLVLYLVPLMGLTMGTLHVSRDRGVNELLFSQPVGRTEILMGRLAGLFASVGASTLLGFGLAALLMFSEVGIGGLSHFLVLTLLTLLLAAIFLAVGAVIGLAADSRTKAFGLSLFVWFFFVLFYDLLVMGLAFLLKERTANLVIFLSLFGNPVDLVRVASLLTISDPTIFGAAGAALVKFLGGEARSHAVLVLSLFLWLVGPLVVAQRILRRLDL